MRIAINSAQRGFTLLEVLVALSILAMSYGVVLQIIGSAANRAALAGDHRRALMIAESQLEYAAAGLSARGIRTSGVVDGRFQWELSYEATSDYSIEGLPSRYTPVRIGVRVSWNGTNGNERSVELRTVRLTRGQQG